jgi:hypothetical protein
VEKVDYVLHLGSRARRIVRQNVFFSIGWMLFLVAVALTVRIPLTRAVMAREGSTLRVAANGLRLLTGSPHQPVVRSSAATALRRGSACVAPIPRTSANATGAASDSIGATCAMSLSRRRTSLARRAGE